MNLKNPLIQFIILFIFAIINHSWIFSHEQFYDAIIFWPVKNLPEVNSLKYFYHIFTNFSGHGGQYRPLGFFGYFYILGTIFNNNFIYYSLISLLIFSTTAYQIKKWVENNFQNSSLSWFASILYIFSPATLFLVYDTSCGGKYLLTSLLFIYQLNYIDKKIINKVSLKNAITLIILNLIAFLLHEGTIIFPLAIFIYLIFKKKQFSFYFFLSFCPASIYLYLRFISNEAPKSGIMHLGSSMLWKNFSVIQGMLWNPLLIRFNIGYLGIFLALIFSLFIFIKKQKIDSLLFLIMNLILTSPFIFLDTHLLSNIIFKGGGWAIIPTVIFITIFIDSLNLYHRPKIFHVILIFLLCFVNFFFHGTKNKISPYMTQNEVMQERYLNRIKSKISNTNEEYIRISGSYPNLLKKHDINSDITIYQSEYIPGLLSKHFPNKKFILTNSARYNSEGLEMETLVQNGYYLYIYAKENDKIYTMDRFDFHSVHNLNIKTNLEIFDFPEIVINE